MSDFGKVLVLGGAGFIGSHVTRSLVDSGAPVRVFTRTTRSARGLVSVLDQIEIHYGDFLDEYALNHALDGVDSVIHLITTTNPNTSVHSGVYDVQTNLLPTIRLLEGCAARGIKNVVFISSGGTIYGEPQSIPIKEDSPLEPISVYGNSKKLVESYIGFFRQNTDVAVKILRASNPYGPGQNPYGTQGLIAVACARLLDNRAIEIFGDGGAVRDFIYISDLVDAVVSALRLDGSITANVSSSTGYSVVDVLERLEAISGRRFERLYLQERKDLVRKSVLCNLKAKSNLGWEPSVELDAGLEKTWQWIADEYG